ncbi:MAG TPA: DHA2 family efflux MFS transporter permease subunit [Ktedonobacteraceae bacterium]|nr:DHA2 family efflux MFS transporter permease subunit [Ktedonobacteraceae bacterium]
MQANVQAAQRAGGLDYKWILAMVVILGVFMSILDQTIVNIAIPRLQTAFGADIHSVQWVLTGYILAQGVATPLAAYFADTLGIKRFYMFSLAAFTAGSALCGIAWSLPILIAFRVLQGLGGAALFPLSLTLLFRAFPPAERGVAMGSFGVPALLAPAIGPTLGGYLVTYSGWQLIFYINVPVGILALLLSALLIREYRPETHPRFDALGCFFVAVGLATVLYGLSSASTDGWDSAPVLGALGIGLFSLLLFVVTELVIAGRGGDPLLNLRLFANGPFRASIVANIFVIFSLFGGLFLFPIYLQTLRQLSPFQAGVTLLPQALASMVSVLVGGRLVDRLGVRTVMVPGLIVLGIATWQLSFLDLHTSYSWFQFLLILRGLALGLTVQPLTVAMMSEVHPRQLAQASALSTVSRSVASSLGIAVLATLVQSQTAVHYGHLAEQVTPFSKLGGLLLAVQAYFVAHGASITAASTAALQLVARFVQGEAFILAMQDAFRLTLLTIGVALIALFFVRTKSHEQLAQTVPASSTGVEQSEEMAAAEAMLAG